MLVYLFNHFNFIQTQSFFYWFIAENNCCILKIIVVFCFIQMLWIIGDAIEIFADLYVESFGNIQEVNMVSICRVLNF